MAERPANKYQPGGKETTYEEKEEAEGAVAPSAAAPSAAAPASQKRSFAKKAYNAMFGTNEWRAERNRKGRAATAKVAAANEGAATLPSNPNKFNFRSRRTTRRNRKNYRKSRKSRR